MKLTKKLSFSEYHPLQKPLSIQDYIQKLVQKEDEIMHANNYYKLPENISYKEMEVNRVEHHTGLYTFISSLVP